VLARAFVLPWEQRKAILRAAIIPLLVVTALGLAGAYTPIHAWLVDWAWLLVCSLATGWFAVSVHRCVLLDAAGAREGFTAASLVRMALYAISVAAIWAMFSGLMQSLSFIGTALLVDYSDAAHSSLELFIQSTRVSLASMFIAAAIVAVISGRLCLLLPALAIDADVRDALRAARGNTLRLTVVFSLLPAALALLGDLLVRDDSTPVETGLLVVLGAIFAIVEVVALSLSYRELTSPAPPPTDPPA